MRRLIILAALLSLVACDDDKPKPPPSEERIRIYSSREECVAEKGLDACAEAWEKAAVEHAKSAPRYNNREACEGAYGRCEARKTESGADIFLPLMAGFMLGNALSSSNLPRYAPVYTNRSNMAFLGNQAIGTYRDCRFDNSCGSSSGSFVGRTGAGSSAVWSSGSYTTRTYTPPPSSFGSKPVGITPSVTARGGFGASASSAATSSGG